MPIAGITASAQLSGSAAEQALDSAFIGPTSVLFAMSLAAVSFVSLPTISSTALFEPNVTSSVVLPTISSTTLLAPTAGFPVMTAKAGAFNIGTATAGNMVSVTGVGFQPSVVMFFWSGTTSSGSLSISTSLNFHQGFGVALSSTSRRGGCNSAIDATSPTQIRHNWSNDACIVQMSSSSDVTAGKADFVSMDSDGFTLIIDEQFASDLRIQYLAFAKSGMSAVLGTFTMPAAGAGSQTISGIGLGTTPTFLLVFGLRTNVSNGGMNCCFGATDGTNAWAYDADQSDATAAGTQTRSYLRSGEIFAAITQANPPTSIDNRASFTSFGNDEFTINWAERTATLDVHYLALAGVSAAVGASNSSASTFTTSGLSFAPKLEFLMTHGDGISTADTVQNEARASRGIATGPSERFCNFCWTRQNAGASVDAYVSSREDAIAMLGLNATPTITEQVDVSAFNSDGVSHTRDVNGSANFAHAWFALG